jgi:hypothetical protein
MPAKRPTVKQGTGIAASGKDPIKADRGFRCHLWRGALHDRASAIVNFYAGDALMASHDMKSAEKTYGGFISMLKWAIPVIAIATLIVIALIAE